MQSVRTKLLCVYVSLWDYIYDCLVDIDDNWLFDSSIHKYLCMYIRNNPGKARHPDRPSHVSYTHNYIFLITVRPSQETKHITRLN